MCRYTVHSQAASLNDLSERIGLELREIAAIHLGSIRGDIELFIPMEKLGLYAPILTVDAEFTVGDERGDIAPDVGVFRSFADHLLSFLSRHSALDGVLKEGDTVAVWVRPDQGKSIYLSGMRLY